VVNQLEDDVPGVGRGGESEIERHIDEVDEEKQGAWRDEFMQV